MVSALAEDNRRLQVNKRKETGEIIKLLFLCTSYGCCGITVQSYKEPTFWLCVRLIYTPEELIKIDLNAIHPSYRPRFLKPSLVR
jgi:hypothetical protein